MKRFYLFLALILAVSTGSFAQRSADIQLITFNPTAGDTLVIDSVNSHKFEVSWGFRNNGPDSIAITDSLIMVTAYGDAFLLTLDGVGGIPVGDTVYFSDSISLANGPAGTVTLPWCDSMFMIPVTGGATLSDPNIANNKNCFNIVTKNLNGTTGISQVVSGNNFQSLNAYPNPASNEVRFDYNFASAASAVVNIRDIVGKRVYQQDLGKVSGQQQIALDLSSLSTGTYVIELMIDNTKVIGKFSIQK